MYLLILCVLISWPVIIIFFMLFCSYQLQMAGGLSRSTLWMVCHSQSPCDWRYLIYVLETPNYAWNYMVLQDGILSAPLLGSVLVLVQAWAKGVCLRANIWVFCPIVLYRASPRYNNGIELYLDILGELCGGHQMDVVLHLYVCPFVSEWIERKLYLYETPMHFNYFAYFVHVMLYYVVCSYFVLAFWYW